jgi:hypothetical protein
MVVANNALKVGIPGPVIHTALRKRGAAGMARHPEAAIAGHCHIIAVSRVGYDRGLPMELIRRIHTVLSVLLVQLSDYRIRICRVAPGVSSFCALLKIFSPGYMVTHGPKKSHLEDQQRNQNELIRRQDSASRLIMRFVGLML